MILMTRLIIFLKVNKYSWSFFLWRININLPVNTYFLKLLNRFRTFVKERFKNTKCSSCTKNESSTVKNLCKNFFKRKGFLIYSSDHWRFRHGQDFYFATLYEQRIFIRYQSHDRWFAFLNFLCYQKSLKLY